MSKDKRSFLDNLVAPLDAPAGTIDPSKPLHPARPTLPRLLTAASVGTPRHLGLWWERYGHSFAKKERNFNKPEVDRREWTEQLATHSRILDETLDRRVEYANRLTSLALKGKPKGLSFNLVLTSRLVTGFGQPHPIENGLLFHPTLGCPYVPGSSLKGTVQAFADEWLMGHVEAPDEEQELRQSLDRIFGQPKRLSGQQSYGERETRLGSVCFLEAVPVSTCRIVSDVMTPHVGSYLTNPDYDQVKLEIESPNPIHFPVVERGAVFRFTLVPTATAGLEMDEDEISSDIQLAGGWLVAGLKTWGIGAKTKSGYGRFNSNTPQPD